MAICHHQLKFTKPTEDIEAYNLFTIHDFTILRIQLTILVQ